MKTAGEKLEPIPFNVPSGLQLTGVISKSIMVIIVNIIPVAGGSKLKKSLTSIGGSLGLIIDKPIADLYGIDRNTKVEILPLEDGLSIRFLNRKAQEDDSAVKSAAKDINKRYGKMMKGLAK